MAAQLRALRDYAKNNGYTIAREYVDEAESGRIADRPWFSAMIDEGGKATAPFQLLWDPLAAAARQAGYCAGSAALPGIFQPRSGSTAGAKRGGHGSCWPSL